MALDNRRKLSDMSDFIQLKLQTSNREILIRRNDIKDVLQVNNRDGSAIEIRTKSNDVFTCDSDCWPFLKMVLLSNE